MKCNKVTYDTLVEAKADAKFIKDGQKHKNKKYKGAGKKLRPYKCVYCGLYHLTRRKNLKFLNSKKR